MRRQRFEWSDEDVDDLIIERKPEPEREREPKPARPAGSPGRGKLGT